MMGVYLQDVSNASQYQTMEFQAAFKKLDMFFSNSSDKIKSDIGKTISKIEKNLIDSGNYSEESKIKIEELRKSFVEISAEKYKSAKEFLMHAMVKNVLTSIPNKIMDTIKSS